MIHYTLLPEKEMRNLRREYRVMIFILLMFFCSSAILIGIASLFPAYILSLTQEKESSTKQEVLKKDRAISGIDSIIDEFKKTSEILNKLKTNKKEEVFSQTIKSVIDNRIPNITYNSIFMDRVEDNNQEMQIEIQGISSTRESVLAFKKSLESNPFISKIEFPISDLIKTKNISYAVRFRLKQ